MYEALVEFLYKKNVNTESATLEGSQVAAILALLESGSMVESVRLNLSEKKKMKDLFLVVIKSIDIKQNRKWVASLIQFVSNLCYGTGKFRKMLAGNDANPKEFMAHLKTILVSVELSEIKEESKQDVKSALADEGDRVLLKQAVVTFVGNLSCETALRLMIAADEGGLLSQIFSMFKREVSTMPFDWKDSVPKYLQVMVNCGREDAAVRLFFESEAIKYCELLLTVVKVAPGKEDGNDFDIVARVLNLIGKLCKLPAALAAIA